MIGVNIGVPVPRDPYSFGGWNESKYGHEDITGKSGVEFWTNLKKSQLVGLSLMKLGKNISKIILVSFLCILFA